MSPKNISSAANFRRAMLIVLLAVSAIASPARASLRYFVYISTIGGDATEPNHQGWIEAFAFSAGASNPATIGPGGGTAGITTLSSVDVVKLLDKTSPKLAKAVAAGTNLGNVILDVVNSASGLPVYHIILRNAIASSDQLGGSSELPVETISLEFEAIEWTYNYQGDSETMAYWDRINVIGGPGPMPTPTPAAQQDTDGDGIPDAYEMDNGLNPLVNDANGDKDGDGVSNIGEYRAGTRANDANSVFRVHGISRGNGTILITWSSVTNRIYTIQKGPGVNGPWTNVQSGIPAAQSETSRTVPMDATVLFYQVTTQP
ncbi:MAG: type VI secretion system tube protein Hcp [Chthoniobacterales bacterium]